MKSGGKVDNLEAEISLLWDALHLVDRCNKSKQKQEECTVG